jgi:hypothetical protein
MTSSELVVGRVLVTQTDGILCLINETAFTGVVVPTKKTTLTIDTNGKG